MRMTPDMTLEKALPSIEDDAPVETPPQSICLREKPPDENDRRKVKRAEQAETV